MGCLSGSLANVHFLCYYRLLFASITQKKQLRWDAGRTSHTSFKDTTGETHQLLAAADEIILGDVTDRGTGFDAAERRVDSTSFPNSNTCSVRDVFFCYVRPDYNDHDDHDDDHKGCV